MKFYVWKTAFGWRWSNMCPTFSTRIAGTADTWAAAFDEAYAAATSMRAEATA